MVFDALTIIMAGLGFLAGFAGALAGMYIVIRKIRKEVGLYNRHRRYHPARAAKKLHFEDYGATHQKQPEQPGE